MFLELTDEQQALQHELRDYFSTLISPDEAKLMLTERHGPVYRDVVKRMGRDGWLGVGWPVEFGGRGFINAISAFSGTSIGQPFFDVDGDGAFGDDVISVGGGSVPVGGIDLGVAMPTTPTVIENLLVGGGSSGTTGSINVQNPANQGRISWREIVRD